MSSDLKPFELKADSFSFPTLYLLTNDVEAINESLNEQVARAPAFFLHAPLIFDLSKLPAECVEVDFPMLVGLTRGQGMAPIGVRGGTPQQQEGAQLMELAILGDGRDSRKKIQEVERAEPQTKPPPPEPPRPAVATAESKIITRPVRSGQKIYAPSGDLIVLAPVSSGAELMADGSIHVYAAMRGRMLAGVKGNEKARVFCRSLAAELVSVAGRYMISEDYPAQLIGKSVQVYLADDRLKIDAL
jgi:septum site-determining protein MinC